MPQIVVASVADLDRLEQSIAASSGASAQRVFAQLEKAKNLAADLGTIFGHNDAVTPDELRSRMRDLGITDSPERQ